MTIAGRTVVIGTAVFAAGSLTVLFGIGASAIANKPLDAGVFLVVGWLVGLAGAGIATLGALVPTRQRVVSDKQQSP